MGQGPDPAALQRRLDELRRHAAEAPPHHQGGRQALEERISALERRLAASRRGGGRGRAPETPSER